MSQEGPFFNPEENSFAQRPDPTTCKLYRDAKKPLLDTFTQIKVRNLTQWERGKFLAAKPEELETTIVNLANEEKLPQQTMNDLLAKNTDETPERMRLGYRLYITILMRERSSHEEAQVERSTTISLSPKESLLALLSLAPQFRKAMADVLSYRFFRDTVLTKLRRKELRGDGWSEGQEYLHEALQELQRLYALLVKKHQ